MSGFVIPLGDLVVRLAGDSQSFDDMVDQAQAKMLGAAKRMKTAGQRMMSFGTSMTTFITAPLVALGGLSVKAASDAEETASKFNVVFSSVIDEANRMAAELDKSYGLAATSSKRLLSDTADLLSGFGFTQKKALDLSNQVQKLAVDLASFTNLEGGAEAASMALTKGLLGERESMKRLGIAISEKTDQYKAMLAQVKRTTGAVGVQARALATLRIAQLQSKNAIGDWARTNKSSANQLRELASDFRDFMEDIGRTLIPFAAKAVALFRDWLAQWKALSAATKKFVLIGAGIAAVLGPLLLSAGILLVVLSATVSAVASILGVVSSIAAAIGAPVLAIVAGVIALGVAIGAAVALLVGPGGLASAWASVKEAAGAFAINVFGFFANFKHNVGAIIDWVKKNWFNLFLDVQQAIIVFAKNMTINMQIALRTSFLLWAAWQAFMLRMFRDVFTVDFVASVIKGLVEAAQAVFKWGSVVAETIKNALKGIFDFDLEQLARDLGMALDKGFKDKDFLKTARGIIAAGIADLNAPMEGFKTSTTGKLDLRFDSKFLEDLLKGTEQAVSTGTSGAKPSKEPKAIAAVKKNQEFQTLSIRRFSLDALSATGTRKQEVRAPVMEKQLGTLIEQGKQKPAATAVLG